MPEHFREDEASNYVETLKSSSGPALDVSGRSSVALGAGEAAAFSYGAVYHPWLIGREEDRAFTYSPPDGAACGVLATRALSRGAWVAPANEPLRGVIALTPPIGPDRRFDLQEAQINLIRQEPRGFLALSADTLSDDVYVMPINVRRLLILLRRLALRLGARYAFEPNSASFRRLVQRGLEGMLDQMFMRGAFAGATAAASFQVVTGSSINTPQSVDQGRFIAEIKVAPSLPLSFLTIRLVQSGDRTFAMEGR
jgi:phage tail sheath protein FI